MAFDRPTLQQLVTRIIGDFQARITGASNLLRRSFVRVAGTVYAGACHLLYGRLDDLAKQLFATSADSVFLDVHGYEVGKLRNPAVKAIGSGIATGTESTVIPAGSELQAGSGQIYITDTAATITGGTATVDFTAQLAGEDGNDDAGISLSFVSPISGIDSTITVDSDGIVDGSDEESDDDYRNRILARKQRLPHGGAEHDYVTWAKEYPGVTRVWTFPQYQGNGTIGIAFVRDDDASIIPNETQRDAVKDYIIQHTDPATSTLVGIPVTAEPGLFMIDMSLYSIDLTLAIYPNTTAVQNAVTTKINEVFFSEGGPGKTIDLGQIVDKMYDAVGLERGRIDSPLADISAATNQIHTVGTITWSNY